MKVVTFGELLKEWQEKKSWGIAKSLKDRKLVFADDIKTWLTANAIAQIEGCEHPDHENCHWCLVVKAYTKILEGQLK